MKTREALSWRKRKLRKHIAYFTRYVAFDSFRIWMIILAIAETKYTHAHTQFCSGVSKHTDTVKHTHTDLNTYTCRHIYAFLQAHRHTKIWNINVHTLMGRHTDEHSYNHININLTFRYKHIQTPLDIYTHIDIHAHLCEHTETWTHSDRNMKTRT